MSERMGVVLFGHGARDPEWAGPIRRTCALLQAQAPTLRVELAFLEFMRPGLAEAVARLADEGVRRIVVVPMFIAQGGHLKSEVPELVAAARERHAGCDISLASAVGEADGVIAAMAAYALACAGVLRTG